MDDILSILIKAIINEIDTSKLKDLAKNIDPIKIKAEIDNKEFQSVSKQISELSKSLNKNMKLDVSVGGQFKELDKIANVVTQTGDGIAKVTQEIKTRNKCI